MNIKLKNETSFPQIIVNYDGKTFPLRENEEQTITVDSSSVKLFVSLPEENKVIFNLLFALIDGFVSEEHVISSFNCNFSVELKLQEPISEVFFKDLVARDDGNGYIYYSSFIKTQNADVLGLKYNLFNTDKAKKKTLFYFKYVTSLVPVLVVLTFVLVLKSSILALIAILGVMVLFSIPSWRKASRVKHFYSDEKANEMLLGEYNRLKLKGWNTKFEPETPVDKAIFTALDFVFGKNKTK